nr:bacterial Ig-like domain-containing protein [Clostridia bacterium]
MKKIAKIVLILLMLATCIFAVTACDKNQNTKITLSISNENMPQTVFVKGNELDLSAGKLTVSGKEQTEIALNGEGVAVTGYDKNTVGAQTLTVTYQGASMTFDVKVVERIVAGDKFTKEYVTGEQFDTLAGKLVITKDNGESFDIATSDTKLTFSGFDSQTAGVKNVNVTYKDDQVEYVGVVPVTVYEIDRINFNRMHMKTDYKSHDTELDLSSGHFVVTAKGGSIQNKYIYLDDSMVKTDLDTSLVSESNPSAEQIITISFGGREFQHKITITLTDVTRIQNAAKSLAVLDWSGNDGCKVTDEQGKLAVSAYEMYM